MGIKLVSFTIATTGTMMAFRPLLKTVLIKLGTNDELVSVESETDVFSCTGSEEAIESRINNEN